MTNVFKTAALSLTIATTSTMAFADAHAVDPAMVTCAEFSAMDIQSKDSTLVAIAAVTEGVSSQEIKPSDVAVRCNGSDDETVMSVIENEMMD